MDRDSTTSTTGDEGATGSTVSVMMMAALSRRLSSLNTIQQVRNRFGCCYYDDC